MQELALVEAREHLGANYWRLRLRAPGIAERARPGQFLHLRVGSWSLAGRPDALCAEPPSRARFLLLRRPFCLHRRRGEAIEVAFRVVGPGTRWLRDRRPGDALDVMGPLGRGFRLEPPPPRPLAVAGGGGIAGLFPLLELPGAELLFGANSLREVPWRLLEEVRAPWRLALWERGEDPVRLLEERLEPGVEVFACGPPAMLRRVTEACRRAGVRAQLLLEEMIGCGRGGCRGCAVRTREGYVLLCQEGPVMEAERLAWS